jgi:chemotaxis protein methyltransferase CheR
MIQMFDSSKSYELIRVKLSELTGLRLGGLDAPRLNEYILERIDQLHLNSPDDYLCYLHESCIEGAMAETRLLSEVFSTLETYFMRDSGQMNLLRNVILPEIIERAQKKKEIHIWSAACSTGEEAYSVAIMLSDLIPDWSKWHIRIVGTDINDNAILKAREAGYREWSFRGCHDDFRNMYFQHRDGTWFIDSSIKHKVQFQVMDLVNTVLPNKDFPANAFDLILCRNLFIYLLPETVTIVVKKFVPCLKEDGILMTAHGEIYAHQQLGLNLKVYPESVVFQKTATENEPPVALVKNSNHRLNHQIRPATSSEKIRKEAPHVAELNHSNIDFPQKIEKGANVWKLANSGQLDQALEACPELIHLEPLNPHFHYLASIIHLGQGNLDLAMAYLKKTIYLDPELIAAYIQLAELHYQLGDLTASNKNKVIASGLLKKLKPDELIPLLGENTASQMLNYLENHI